MGRFSGWECSAQPKPTQPFQRISVREISRLLPGVRRAARGGGAALANCSPPTSTCQIAQLTKRRSRATRGGKTRLMMIG
jgi:hypothetical protein